MVNRLDRLLAAEYLRYLWHVVLYVSGSEGDEHIETATAHGIEDVFLVDEVALDAWAQVVIDELTGNAWYWQFARWIDITEIHCVKKR